MFTSFEDLISYPRSFGGAKMDNVPFNPKGARQGIRRSRCEAGQAQRRTLRVGVRGHGSRSRRSTLGKRDVLHFCSHV
jgi:hypothetical protein